MIFQQGFMRGKSDGCCRVNFTISPSYRFTRQGATIISARPVYSMTDSLDGKYIGRLANRSEHIQAVRILSAAFDSVY